MKKCILGICALLSLNVFAADYAVVVHKDNTATISVDDIKGIYQGKVSKFSNGNQVVPIGLKEPENIAFTKQVLGKDPAQLKAYWSKLIFTGKGQPPKEVSSTDAVKLATENPAVIAVIKKEDISDQVKVIHNFSD
jgi:hypothetical protein